MVIGRWPLISTEEARTQAAKLLLACRMGQMTAKLSIEKLPTLRTALPQYAKAKGIKASSLKRYESILKTHFNEWQDMDLDKLSSSAFVKHCHAFAQSKGAAVVEVGRGLIGAMFRYLNAVHGLQLSSPFTRLSEAGLMPERAQPRERKLQIKGLSDWHVAVVKLPEKQRDLLMLLALTALRRNEAGLITCKQIDLDNETLHIPETKTSQPHSLPITAQLRTILERRMSGLGIDDALFDGVSLEHLAQMAIRAGAPDFMLHDLRKLLATVGEQLGYSDAVMRRLLNHKAKRSDTLHRHYVSLSTFDVKEALATIQSKILMYMNG
jgi:integrase